MKMEDSLLFEECQKELEGVNDDSGWFNEYIEHARKRLLQDFQFVQKQIFPGARVAEFGAAPFLLTLALSKRAFNVDAYDIAPERFQGLSDLPFSLQKADLDGELKNLPQEEYDLILFNELFEHLRGNLIRTMSQIRECLKPEGLLMLTTPNLRSVTGLYKLIFRGIGYSVSSDMYHEWNKIGKYGHMGHVREYTSKELVRFFGRLGYEVVLVKYRPVKLGTGWKNQLFYLLEVILPGLRSNTVLLLKKK